MDPLSITASTAALLGITINLTRAVQSLYEAIKRKSLLLLEIKNDLTALQTVLEELSSSNTSKVTDDTPALAAVLHGCQLVMQQIDKELSAVKSALSRGIVARNYAKATFSSRMESIAALRNQLDKYKATLMIALQIRAMKTTSNKDIHDKIDELRRKLPCVSREDRSGWQNPIQRYLFASSEIFPRIPANKASTLVLGTVSDTSSTTIVENKNSYSNVENISSASTAGDSFDATTVNYGTFDDWLAAFTSEDDTDATPVAGNQDDTSQHITGPAHSPMPAVEDGSNTVPVTVRGLVSGHFKAEYLDVPRSGTLLSIMKCLHERGHQRVCGFRCGNILISPFVNHDQNVQVEVVEGHSCYSILEGLRINLGESFEVFYDNFIRFAENDVGSLATQVQLGEASMQIIDRGLHEDTVVNVSFARTLRVPEDGKTYGAPVLFAPIPLFQVEHYKSRLPADIVRKGGIMLPLYQREALALSFTSTGKTAVSSNYLPTKSTDFAIRCLAGTVNILNGRVVPHQHGDDAQQHIVVPAQSRLDGFPCDRSLVKQFVAMALGSGYTAEGQLTGKEKFGGLQLIVAPKFRGRGDFLDLPQTSTPNDQRLVPGTYVSMGGDEVRKRSKTLVGSSVQSKGSDDDLLFKMPQTCRHKLVHEMLQEMNFRRSDGIVLEPVFPLRITLVLKARKSYVKVGSLDYGMEPANLGLIARNTRTIDVSPFLGLVDFYDILMRKLDVDEVVLFDGGTQLLQRSMASEVYLPLYKVITSSHRLICQLYKFKYTNMEPGPAAQSTSFWPRRRRKMHDEAKIICPAAPSAPSHFQASTSVYAIPELSASGPPTHGYSDYATSVYNMNTYGPLQQDTDHHYSVTAEETKEGRDWSSGITTQSYMPMSPVWHAPGRDGPFRWQNLPKTDHISKQRWDMGLGAGGLIQQGISEDSSPTEWNWSRASFINIQFLNSVVFEQLTSIPAPPCPVTFKDYVAARLPFYQLVQNDAINGVRILASLKSVGEIDSGREISISSRMRTDLAPSGCILCEENLTDTILTPCNHIFCRMCVRDTMVTGDELDACGACGKQVRKVLHFSGPMEMPMLEDTGTGATDPDNNRTVPNDFNISAESPDNEPSDSGTTTASLIIATELPGSEPTSSAFRVVSRAHTVTEVWTLQESVTTGDSIAVHELLSQGHETDSGECVHLAARLGHCNILILLNEHGWDMNAPDATGYHPIHTAASHGQDAVILLLLMTGINIETETEHDEVCQRLTPLQLAARHGQLRTLKLLIKKDARTSREVPTAHNCPNPGPLLTTSPKYTASELDPRQTCSPLHLAALYGHHEVVDFLLSQSYEVDYRTVPDGVTPLLCASINGHFHVVKQLVEAGADVETEWVGCTPLALLLHQNTWPRDHVFEAIEALLRCGAASCTFSPTGMSPLHVAAVTGHVEVLRLLFDRGVDSNIVCWRDEPFDPLSLAFAQAQFHCCELLISHGAKFNPTIMQRLAEMLNGRSLEVQENASLHFSTHWKDANWRRQSLQTFANMLKSHLTHIIDIPKFFLALARLGRIDLISEITIHYITERPNHQTTGEILNVKTIDLVHHASLYSKNAVIVECLLSKLQEEQNPKAWAEYFDSRLSDAIHAAAMRNDPDMLNVIFSSLHPNVASREAADVSGKLSSVLTKNANLQVLLKQRQSLPVKPAHYNSYNF